jgi:hypothetical protein
MAAYLSFIEKLRSLLEEKAGLLIKEGEVEDRLG